MAPRTATLRAIPSVDRVLSTATAAAALARFQRGYVTESIRAVLADVRRRLTADATSEAPTAA